MKRISNVEILERFRVIQDLKDDNCQKNHEEINKLQNTIVIDLGFLVYSNAKRYKNLPNYEDLVQEGFIGLTKAARRFDYTLSNNFFNYATQWILNGIKRSAKKYDVVYNPERVKTVYIDSDNVQHEGIDEFS